MLGKHSTPGLAPWPSWFFHFFLGQKHTAGFNKGPSKEQLGTTTGTSLFPHLEKPGVLFPALVGASYPVHLIPLWVCDGILWEMSAQHPSSELPTSSRSSPLCRSHSIKCSQQLQPAWPSLLCYNVPSCLWLPSFSSGPAFGPSVVQKNYHWKLGDLSSQCRLAVWPWVSLARCALMKTKDWTIKSLTCGTHIFFW